MTSVNADSTGHYRVDHLPPGTYFGWVISGPDRPTFASSIPYFQITSGSTLQLDISLPGASLPQIWEDLNADGIVDSSSGGTSPEPGLGAIRMRVTHDDQPENPGIAFQSNENGQIPRFAIAQIQQVFGTTTGTFTLTVVEPPPGGQPTFDSDGIETPNTVAVWYDPEYGDFYSFSGGPPRFGYQLMTVEYLTRSPITGDVEVMGGLLYESVPRPHINLSVVSATLAGNDKTLRITVQVEFRDTLNELLGFTNSQRVTQLDFTVNGETPQVESTHETKMSPNTVPFWRKYDSRTVVTKKLIVPNAHSGAYRIRVVASPNAVGYRSWAHEQVLAESLLVQTPDGLKPQVQFEEIQLGKGKNAADFSSLLVPKVKSAKLADPVVVPGIFDGPEDATEPYVIRLTVPESQVGQWTQQVTWDLNGEPVHLTPQSQAVPGETAPPGMKYLYVGRGAITTGPPWCLALVRGRDQLEPKLMPDGALAAGALILSYQDVNGTHVIDNRPIVTEDAAGISSGVLVAAEPAPAALDPNRPGEPTALPPQFSMLGTTAAPPLENPLERKGANGYSIGDVVRAYLLIYSEPGSRALFWLLYGNSDVYDVNTVRADVFLGSETFLGIGDNLNSEGYGYLNWMENDRIKKRAFNILISDKLQNTAVAAEVLAKALENIGNGLFNGTAWRDDFKHANDELQKLFENIVAPEGQEETVIAAITALRDHRLHALKQVTADLEGLIEMGLSIALPAPVGIGFTLVLDASKVVDQYHEAEEDLDIEAFMPVIIAQIPWPLDLVVAQAINPDNANAAPNRTVWQTSSTRGHYAPAVTMAQRNPRSLMKKMRSKGFEILSTRTRLFRHTFNDADAAAIKPFAKIFRDAKKKTRSVVAARVEMMREIRKALADGRLTPSQVETMVASRVIPKIEKQKQRTGLRKLLELVKGDGKAAHHDLPLQMEEKFLSVGLDPNDEKLGLGVPWKTHSDWHEWPDKKLRFDGGPYNAAWRQQFDLWKTFEITPTADDILAYRAKLHSGELIEIRGPVNTIRRSFIYNISK